MNGQEQPTQNLRGEFLQKWYGDLWRNIDRSFTTVWQSFAAIGAAMAIYAGIFSGRIPTFEGTIAAILVFTWAVALTLDSNKWFIRNIIFISRIEQEFLRDDDYGRIIPKEYRQHGFRIAGFYKVNLSTLVVACILFDLNHFFSPYESFVHHFLVLVATLLGFAIDFRLHKKYKRELEKI